MSPDEPSDPADGSTSADSTDRDDSVESTDLAEPADSTDSANVAETVRAYLERRKEWVRATVERDGAALETIPGGPWTVYGLVGSVVLLFSALRLGITDLYTESLPFLVLAIVVGLLGWTPGVALVVVHAGVDLILSLGDLSTKTAVGRVVTYIVLYALVVSIPSTQRALHARLDRADQQYPWLDWVAAPASAVFAGVLVFLWAEVAPYLIRAAFESTPTVVAVATVQNNGLLLAVVTALLAAVVAVGYQRRVGIVVTLPWDGETSLVPGRFVWVRRFLRYGAVVVVVSGIITSALDVVVLAIALVAADVVLPEVGRIDGVRRLLLAIPYTLRLGLAMGLTFLAARFVMAIRYGPVAGSRFFPLVASLAVGLFVFRLLLNVDETLPSDATTPTETEPPPTPPTPPTAVVVVLVALVTLGTVPDVALAHDCSSLADCENGARAGTAAGVTALALALWYWTSGPSASLGPGGPGGDGSGPADVPDGERGAATDAPVGEREAAADAGVDTDTDTDSAGESPPADIEGDSPERRPASAVERSVASGDSMAAEPREDEDDWHETAGRLKIVSVVASETVTAEYVVLRNVGDGPLDLSGWTVSDDEGADYTIPEGTVLEPGTRLRLYTGAGTDTESTLHWGLDRSLWTTPGASVSVRNAVGDVAARVDAA